jgi:hypothetical protein
MIQNVLAKDINGLEPRLVEFFAFWSQTSVLIATVSPLDFSRHREECESRESLPRLGMNKLILTLIAFVGMVMPVISGDLIEPVSADPLTSNQGALILRILKAMETHDYRTLLVYTLDKETNYFGHKNSSNAFIQQDMTQDARSYNWCRFVPDSSTFQTSAGHDSIEYDSDALDLRGKEHKARCRLDIYYTPAPSPRLQALSLKVLPNHPQSVNSGSTIIGPASGQDDESGFENAVTQCREIIKTKIIPRYETKEGFTVKPLAINYQDDPVIDKCLEKYGSIWKQLDPVVAETYANFQRKVNEQNKPEADKYRQLLVDAFHRAVELRGGGSASVQFYVFAPAHVEWMIAHLGANSDNVPDENFVSQLTKDLTVGASPERHEVQAVLVKLRAVEQFLNKGEAAFVRAEFLSYFGR